MGKGQQQKHQAEKLAASASSKKQVSDNNSEASSAAIRVAMSAFLQSGQEMHDVDAMDQVNEEKLMSANDDEEVPAETAMETEVDITDAAHLTDTRITPTGSELRESAPDTNTTTDVPFLSAATAVTTNPSFLSPVSSVLSPESATAPSTLPSTGTLLTDMKTIILDLRNVKFELPSIVEICRTIDGQLSGLSSEYHDLLAIHRPFSIPAAALAFTSYST